MSSSRRALFFLLGILILGTLGGSGSALRRPPTGPVAGWLFFSANTRQGLTFDDSVRLLRSPAQRHGRLLVPGLLEDLGLPSAGIHDAIGDWEGGVENSLMVHLPHIRDAATLRYAAAWLGLACRQQAVLIFHAREDDGDRLTTIDVRASIGQVRRALDGLGILDRTLVATNGGCRVIVVDPQGRRQGRLEQAARTLKGRMVSQPGRCEMLAGSTPDAATRRYRDAMWTWRVTAKR
jgi:hypothetical protein